MPVEGNVARGAEGDFRNSFCHVGGLRDGRPKDSLSTSNPSQNPAQPSHSLSLPTRHLRLGPSLPRAIRRNRVSSSDLLPQTPQVVAELGEVFDPTIKRRVMVPWQL